MRLRAMAKINLGLDIIGKREDGYHEVRMIMQTIRMYDVLEIRKKTSPGISLSTNLPYIPCGLSMKLTKSVPVAAGMAGGSSDAAAAFVGVNRLFHLGLSEEELMKRAVQVGADVPYCVMRGTALAEGIGEKLTRLPDLPGCYILIGKPGINVSTRTAYENLDLNEIRRRPDIDGMICDIKNKDLYSMTGKMENVFEPGIMAKYPVIREIRDLMEKQGALKAMMSGSGPTVFGIFDDAGKMQNAARALKKSGLAKTMFATRTYKPGGGTKDE